MSQTEPKVDRAFFRLTILPIIEEAANDDCEMAPGYGPNPLRPMLRQLLGYIQSLKQDYSLTLQRCWDLNREEAEIEDLLVPIWEEFPETDGDTTAECVANLIKLLRQMQEAAHGSCR